MTPAGFCQRACSLSWPRKETGDGYDSFQPGQSSDPAGAGAAGQRRARRENRLFAIEGARLCADAARSGAAVTAFLYTRRAAETYRSYWEPVAAAAQRRFEIPEALMKYAADTATPQGMLCVCAMLDNRPGLDTIEPHARYLALEDIQDPANLGTVIRTAEALGLSALLLSDGCCDPYNPKVLRGSMGGVFRLPLLPAGDLAHTAEILGRRGVRCFACVPKGARICAGRDFPPGRCA